MKPELKFPSIHYLKKTARCKIPHFVWEYLDSGTGSESTTFRNQKALQDIRILPAIMKGLLKAQTSKKFLGKTYDLPFGIAPIGMSGLIWPDAEVILARIAEKQNIPYTLSTVACQTPETVGPILQGLGWFQLYPPKNPEIRKDMMRRIVQSAFEKLVITVDVPVASRRERQTRGGITTPPVLTPRLLSHIIIRPEWALRMLINGKPGMPFVASYGNNIKGLPSTEHIGYLMRTSPDMNYIKWVRDNWKGDLIIKGILNPLDVQKLEKIGIDAIWVSNHAGRQFDAAPATIEVLPEIRKKTKLPIIFDSGIESGLDIIRSLALGADFVMMGRAWHYALGAMGKKGPLFLSQMLRADLIANMGQLGLQDLESCINCKIHNI